MLVVPVPFRMPSMPLMLYMLVRLSVKIVMGLSAGASATAVAIATCSALTLVCSRRSWFSTGKSINTFWLSSSKDFATAAVRHVAPLLSFDMLPSVYQCVVLSANLRMGHALQHARAAHNRWL